MDTLANIRTAVQDDLTIGDESTLYSPTLIDRTINRSYRKVGGLFPWPELQDAKETVTQIKTDMMNIDIIRGKNIANLCSAGYLESDIIPTFNSLSENQKMQDFLPYHEQLVTQTPTSIFISNKHNSTSLKNEVLEKTYMDYTII